MKKTCLIALLSLSLGTSSLMLADSSHVKSHSMQPISMVEREASHMRQALNLSTEQQEKIQKIIAEAKPKFEEYAVKIRETKMKIKEGWHQNFDADKIEDLAKEHGDAITKLISLRAQTKKDIMDVLTNEQKAKWTQTKFDAAQMDKEKTSSFIDYMKSKFKNTRKVDHTSDTSDTSEASY